MITENNIKELEIITSNLAYKDYIEAYQKSDRFLKGRYTSSGRERKFKGYSLSSDTLEARELLIKSNSDNIIEKDIEIIKGYLLKTKMLRPELLEVNRN